MSKKLVDQLEIWGVENDIIVFSDGSYGAGLELVPVDTSCWDDDRINAFAESTSQLLNGLPVGISVQFVQDIRGGHESCLEGHLESEDPNGVGSVLARERVSALKRRIEEGSVSDHRLYCFVRRSPKINLVERPKLFSKTSKFENIAEHRFHIECNQTRQIRSELGESLKSSSLHPRFMSAEEILDLTYDQWNPDRAVPRGNYNPCFVRDGLLFTDAEIGPLGFQLGAFHHRIISLKMLPDVTYAAMAARLRQLPFDSRLFLTIAVPDQQKEFESLQTQRRVAFSLARGKQGGVSDIESETKLEDLESLLEEMVAQGEKVFHVSFNVLLRSKSPGDLEAQATQTLMAVRELSGAEGMVETIASFDIFRELAIPNARAKERSKCMKTSNLADFLPLYGPWSGHEDPRILLRSRLGSIIKFDPFAPSLANYNHVISGGSGSGKSYLTNILLLQALKDGPRLFVVDIGGSYQKLCENLGGQYIELGIAKGHSINPFDLLPGESAPGPEKIKLLVGLLEIMTRESDEARVNRLTRTEFEEIIQQCYDSSSDPRVSDVRNRLINHLDPSIRKFGRILSVWCGNSPFGAFTDRPTNIELTNPVVCFDLKGLNSHPELQAVCLFLITDLVWREVQKDRSTKKFLIFDECWKLLENDAGSTFIAEVFRTFRKYYASAIAISQNIDDFAKSQVAQAILSNSSTKWILMQKGADQHRLMEVLQLNANEMELIKSLTQKRGTFSEALLMTQDQHSVVVIDSTPLEYWIATTDARDLALLEKEKELFIGTQLELLKHVAQKFPRGASA